MEELLKILPPQLQVALIVLVASAFVVVVIRRFVTAYREAGEVHHEQPQHAVIESGEIADLSVIREAVKKQDAVLDSLKRVDSLAKTVDANNLMMTELLVVSRRSESLRDDIRDLVSQCLNILKKQEQQDLVDERIKEYLKSLSTEQKVRATRKVDDSLSGPPAASST